MSSENVKPLMSSRHVPSSNLTVFCVVGFGISRRAAWREKKTCDDFFPPAGVHVSALTFLFICSDDMYPSEDKAVGLMRCQIHSKNEATQPTYATQTPEYL